MQLSSRITEVLSENVGQQIALGIHVSPIFSFLQVIIFSLLAKKNTHTKPVDHCIQHMCVCVCKQFQHNHILQHKMMTNPFKSGPFLSSMCSPVQPMISLQRLHEVQALANPGKSRTKKEKLPSQWRESYHTSRLTLYSYYIYI